MAVPKKRTSKSKKMLEKQIGKEKDIKQLKNLYL
jgi:ribosomal protein L32